MKTVSEENLLLLKKPLDLKWRVLRSFPTKTNPTHVIMGGYVDARDVMDHLDETVGPANWQTEYFECKAKQFCRIGIKIGEEWVWKGDNGTESATERQKGETSDSFKRAAVHWGINRAAYQTGEVKLKARDYGGKPYPADDNGTFLKGTALYQHCNKLANVDLMEVEFDKEYERQLSELNEGKEKKTTLKSNNNQTPHEMP